MNFIGIDVGKQELVAYDGKGQRSFPNTPELREFRAFLQDYGKEVTLTFEPTSTYSRFLEMLCAEGSPLLEVKSQDPPSFKGDGGKEVQERPHRLSAPLPLRGEEGERGTPIRGCLELHPNGPPLFLLSDPESQGELPQPEGSLELQPLVLESISEKLKGLEEN
ncbi:MAG: hypothetical protein ACPL7L_03590, partial [bacterium]